MNKDELKYVKENYFSKELDLNFLFEAISEVLEVDDSSQLHEQMTSPATLTLQAIPDIDVTELGWTDVRTVGDQEVSGPARNQLLQFLANIQGTDLSDKLASLSAFYNDPESVRTEGSSLGGRIASALSYLVFYKTLTKIISNFNAASAGFNFEAFLAVLLGGKQIPANTGAIADFVAEDNTPISLKLYSEKSLVVGGSFTDLVGDLVDPQFGHDFMQYVVVMKSFEDDTQGLDVKGVLKFHRFDFTIDNIANIILGSMGKSVKCIELPAEFIEQVSAGNEEYDFNATLPSQENLPSPEELEVQFIELLRTKIDSLEYGIEQAQVNNLTQILDWAKNDELFSLVERGESLLVARGASAISENNPALRKAVDMSFGEMGLAAGQLQMIRRQVAKSTAEVNEQFTKKKQKSERAKILKTQGVFADAQTSVDFYNGLSPELKKKALLNSRGYLSTLQFDLNRGQVLKVESLAGEYSAVPSGQSGTDIGTIKIGAVYVQEVLNKLTAELNGAWTSIFQSVKEIQEGTYAFMAGGLADDSEAEKAIKASRNVEEKTQEIRPEV